jgi:hypothetical protein
MLPFPAEEEKYSTSKWLFNPGVGIREASRQKKSIHKVNAIRDLSSGIMRQLPKVVKMDENMEFYPWIRPLAGPAAARAAAVARRARLEWWNAGVLEWPAQGPPVWWPAWLLGRHSWVGFPSRARVWLTQLWPPAALLAELSLTLLLPACPLPVRLALGFLSPERLWLFLRA